MPGFVDPKLANIVAELNRSAPSGAHAPEPVADTSSLDRLLAQAARRGASDVLLIAGKGHEPYQEIQGTKYPFDDRLVAREALHGRTG